MTLIDIFTGLAFIVSIGLFLFTLTQRKKISRYVSVKDLGTFEKDLPNLKQVVVLADKVEKPSSTLAEAVEDNFSEGVKYLFLVSSSNAEREVSGYYLLFEALARKVAHQSDNVHLVKDLVEIKRLSYNWPDVPYIFYQYQKEDEEQRYTIAFRGNTKKKGISDFYEKLAPSHSRAMVTALLSEAPDEIKANLTLVENVKNLPKVATIGNQ